MGLLEAMEADGVAPDAVTFNTVIAACEAGADHWTAFRYSVRRVLFSIYIPFA